jgi:hypothetical protein
MQVFQTVDKKQRVHPGLLQPRNVLPEAEIRLAKMHRKLSGRLLWQGERIVRYTLDRVLDPQGKPGHDMQCQYFGGRL